MHKRPLVQRVLTAVMVCLLSMGVLVSTAGTASANEPEGDDKGLTPAQQADVEEAIQIALGDSFDMAREFQDRKDADPFHFHERLNDATKQAIAVAYDKGAGYRQAFQAAFNECLGNNKYPTNAEQRRCTRKARQAGRAALGFTETGGLPDIFGGPSDAIDPQV